MSGLQAGLNPVRVPVATRLTGWQRIARERAGITGLVIVAVFALIALLSWAGLLGADWAVTSDLAWAGSSPDHWFGTNRLGQDILSRALRATGSAFQLGVSVAILATLFGAMLGSLAGWRQHSWLDEIVVWLMGVLDSIPFYLFVAAVAFAMDGSAWAMLLAMVVTFWTGTARLVRAEVIRLKEREFVLAARAIGLPGLLILLRHVLPNTLPILLVQTTLSFVAAIKTEVILSFLGIGAKDGISWGLMLAEATQDVLTGHFGNLLSASALLFLMLLGFNLLADAMQDAADVREVIS